MVCFVPAPIVATSPTKIASFARNCPSYSSLAGQDECGDDTEHQHHYSHRDHVRIDERKEGRTDAKRQSTAAVLTGR